MEAAIFDSAVIRQESIVAKMNLVEIQERTSPYAHPGQWGVRTYHDRVEDILRHQIPAEHRPFALALFASVIYLPAQMLEAMWAFLCDDITTRHGTTKDEFATDMHLFDLDNHNFGQEFIAGNGIEGRLDRDRFGRIGTVSDLLDNMGGLSRRQAAAEALTDVQTVISKKFWILITDNVLSGTSVASELRRLIAIRQRLWEERLPTPEKVLVCAQIVTQDAVERIRGELRDQANALEIHHGLFLSSQFKVNSPECTLFADESIRHGVCHLCEWLAQEHTRHEARLQATMEISRDWLPFGFRQVGLTVVTQRNTPSDTVPLLWLAPESWLSTSSGTRRAGRDAAQRQLGETPPYVGPFPRVLSRRTQQAGAGDQKLDRVRRNWLAIAQKLRG